MVLGKNGVAPFHAGRVAMNRKGQDVPLGQHRVAAPRGVKGHVRVA